MDQPTRRPMPWDPGERPAWVQHAIDGDGGPEYALAAEPLDADELVAEAAFRAGTDDFGDDSYVEALDVAVRSIEEEGDLHIVGRWRVREAILRYLESRARAARCLTTDPSIEARPIEAPIVVSGSPRAGTSIMHELLAQDPAHRAPMAWEYWSPAPPPDPATTATDPRIPLAGRDVRLSAALAPSFDGMHEQGARIPREDSSAMGLDLRTDVIGAHYPVESYRKYLAADDMRTAYAWHRRVLQILQHRFEPRTWVVKWPGHVNHVPVMLETYPDARLVVCHRDPLAMLSSVTSLTATLRWAHANSIDFAAIAREQADTFGAQCDHLLEARRDRSDRRVACRRRPLRGLRRRPGRDRALGVRAPRARLRPRRRAARRGAPRREAARPARWTRAQLRGARSRCRRAARPVRAVPGLLRRAVGVSGSPSSTPVGDSVLDGEAWRAFCDRMARLGDRIRGPEFPGTDRDRAEGYRHLATQVAGWLSWVVGYPDARHPAFFRQNDQVMRWGGPNVDQVTRRARLSGTARSGSPGTWARARTSSSPSRTVTCTWSATGSCPRCSRASSASVRATTSRSRCRPMTLTTALRGSRCTPTRRWSTCASTTSAGSPVRP